MFKYGGSNKYVDRFDFFEWSAAYYEDQNEVYKELTRLKIIGKTLAGIKAIGTSLNIVNSNANLLYNTINDAGIEPGELWWERYENLDKVLVPWEIELCEPIQLIFDDHTTVEILPTENGGARIGKNSIPVDLVDGLNKSNIDATVLFKELIGKRIDNISLKEEKTETVSINKYNINRRQKSKEIHTKYSIELVFDYPYVMNITQSSESWFCIRAKGNDWRGRIPYSNVKEAYSPSKEVTIVNGRDCGSTFWIIGIGEEGKRSIPHLDCFGISIDDCRLEEYLTEFLYDYYDPSIQYNSFIGMTFDWYGHNLYTREQMEHMIEDIRRTVSILLENSEDPSLDRIKANWGIPCYDDYGNPLTEKQKEKKRKDHVSIAIDFYLRFCTRIEKMMSIPGNDLISFVGP